jgi:hypothetical protein
MLATARRVLQLVHTYRQFADYACGLSANTASRPDIPLISQFRILCCVAGICAGYVFLLHERWRRRHRRLWWARHFLKDRANYGDNILADLKVEDGAGFRTFVRMTPTDSEVLLQMIGCKISSFSVGILACPHSEHLLER